MKHLLKIAGLCLASMLAVSVAVVASASAAPVWEHCTKGAVSGLTKWENHNCSTVGTGTNEWQWKEVNNTEEVRIKGSLKLSDSKASILGKSSAECSGESIGAVGPGIHGRINEIIVSPAQCRGIENCTTVLKIAPLNLPWQTENFETEKKVLQLLKGTTGKEPGWELECEIAGVKASDKCEQVVGEPESILLENKATGTELLVLGTFQHLRKSTCSLGGAKTGEVTGSLAVLQANSWGLRVS
jgi:hypothetical protein